jgi:hypothetical protein
MEIEWTETALDDLAGLETPIARRVKRAVERFAETGAGSVKRLQAIDPLEFGNQGNQAQSLIIQTPARTGP